MINPYAATSSPDAANLAHSWRGRLVGLIAFAVVIAVAAGAGSIAPGIAYLAGAPNEFTVSLLQVSLAVGIPFGLVVAYFAALCACRRLSVTRLCWFFAVLVIVVPLVLHPKTAGPLVEYTGFAVLLTAVSAIIAANVLRRYSPSAGSPRRL